MRALALAKYAIFHGYNYNIFLKESIKEWNDEKDIITRCAKLMIKSNDQFMVALTVIVNILANDCKHPKKDHDKTHDGILYCMNCNADLPKIKSKKK